ncbi:C-terminal part of DNA polymerase, bacteriophage-type [Legionella beliardensis]|uniref:Type-4 uracil-DNA glycosylase n=1 Tax=Legionella beliardensis TaxID=91822 RepID=A0A378I387_9GAMM|nr:UdgX family uracil-DNA binding protein [Legionella beliardensis]STX29220.1 C-terminal part of DNA polymerase, bacteriophage-type [Legionella beliardensis]
MITIKANNFEQWRSGARYLLAHDQCPASVFWEDDNTGQSTLFDKKTLTPDNGQFNKQFFISKKFITLAKIIACHRSADKWGKLYDLLWRLTHDEPYLLNIASDPLVYDLLRMHKAVTRDAHKMKAFVRFCKFTEDNGNDYFLAWYKPDHLIVHLVAPFFQMRFAVMNWVIITPDETVSWNGKELVYGAGKILLTNPKDGLETLWQTYYKATFNPARVKIKAMKKEMPVRFWHNLPETQVIPSLLNEAPRRVAQMMQHQEGISSSAEQYFPQLPASIELFKGKAQACRGCPLYKNATQTVFGTGFIHAKLMIVGEQPGDQEDRKGVPFIGPAGQLLRDILKKLTIQIEAVYLTNTVKHFKFKLENGRRIHHSPNIREIHACKPWLLAEIELIKPDVVLCLGLTAAKALINPAFRIKDERGCFKPVDNYLIGATYHPSAILRTSNLQLKDHMLKTMMQDIGKAYQLSQIDNQSGC